MDNSDQNFIVKLISIGGQEITPLDFDIRELRTLLENVENLLYPEINYPKRPMISLTTEFGSSVSVIHAKPEAVMTVKYFLEKILKEESLNFDESEKRKKAISYFQHKAKDKDYVWELSTSFGGRLYIDKHTTYYYNKNLWIKSQLYLYGIIIAIGGKSKPSITIDSDKYGVIPIRISKDTLTTLEEEHNLLYTSKGFLVNCSEHIEKDLIDEAVFVDMFEYSKQFDEKHNQQQIKNASQNWRDIEVQQWLEEIRGNELEE